MASLTLATFTILISLCSIHSKVVLPECPADSDLKSNDLNNLDVKLKDGNGLVTESFSWIYKNDIQQEGHLHLEYLFDDIIHFEAFPKNKAKKTCYCREWN